MVMDPTRVKERRRRAARQRFALLRNYFRSSFQKKPAHLEPDLAWDIDVK